VSEQIGLKRSFIYLLLDDFQEDLGGVESEDTQHHFGHVEL
jgi:hypothetical protein